MSRLLPDPYQQRITAAVTGQAIGLAVPPPSLICVPSVISVEPPRIFLTEAYSFASAPAAEILATIGDFVLLWSGIPTVFSTDSIFLPVGAASFSGVPDTQAPIEPPAQTPGFIRTISVTTS